MQGPSLKSVDYFVSGTDATVYAGGIFLTLSLASLEAWGSYLED